MFDPIRHPHLLRLRLLWDRLKARLFYRPAEHQQASRQLIAFYDRIWREAAAQVGATVHDLGNDVLEIRLGDRWTRVWQNCSSIDDLAAHVIVRTKGVMYRLLSAHGLPCPRHLEFTFADLKKAAAFLESTSRPCVIKPACDAGGGRAVVTGIRTRWQLARAAWKASAAGDHPIIEEQVEGENYRLLYLDGKLLDVVKRESPSVVADGKSTVRQLIARLNQERLQQNGAVAHVLVTLDLDLQATLRCQGLSLRSVPASGTRIRLKTVINENSSQENVTACDELCAEILADAAQAVQLSGLRLAGVDIITANPRRSLRETGGVILEVNSPPGYFWHYHKRDGSFPVALYVLRALFDLTDKPNWTGAAKAASRCVTV